MLAEKISLLVENTELRKKLGLCARKYAEKYFSIDNVINKHLEVYNSFFME